MTLFDAGVIGTIVLLGLICFMLGFTRVILGVGGWIGAGIITFYGFPYLLPIARANIGIKVLDEVVAGFVLFVIGLIVINLITHTIARAVSGSSLRALDKSLGLVLGLGIGAIAVCFAFLLLQRMAVADGGAPPPWMQQSRTLPLIEWGARALLGLAPAELRGRTPEQRGQSDQREMERRLLSPGAPAAPAGSRAGYTDEQRRGMDRLFEGQR